MSSTDPLIHLSDVKKVFRLHFWIATSDEDSRDGPTESVDSSNHYDCPFGLDGRSLQYTIGCILPGKTIAFTVVRIACSL